MQPVPDRRVKHECAHEGCDKQTLVRFCKDHLPHCKKCGKTCRKFEGDDLESVFCFRHSQHLRDKTREHVANHRMRMRARSAAINELLKTTSPLFLEYLTECADENGGESQPEDVFKAWLGEKHPEVRRKYEDVVNAMKIINCVSVDKLPEFTAQMIAIIMA